MCRQRLREYLDLVEQERVVSSERKTIARSIETAIKTLHDPIEQDVTQGSDAQQDVEIHKELPPHGRNPVLRTVGPGGKRLGFLVASYSVGMELLVQD